MTLVRLQWRTSADFYTGMTPTIYDIMKSREQRGNHGTCDTSNNFFQCSNYSIFFKMAAFKMAAFKMDTSYRKRR